ncbi:MAG: T9SS type A sorting domain-containing protein [Ignavibacteriae bacterium]|nr:T9SS type A sorting domain-containing protein [Ignavibacteriota bacterium]
MPLTPTGQRPAGYHNFAVDDESRLYFVYQSSSSSSGKGWYLVHGKAGSFSDTTLVSDLPPGYVTRNTSAIAARGRGEIAVTYSPGIVRSGTAMCDIFMKRGVLSTTNVSGATGLPSAFVLHQNYPNPFNPSTRIKFRIGDVGGQRSEVSRVMLKVYDVLGREVATLVDENLSAGKYEATFDAKGLASGLYFYRLQSGSFVETKKLMVLR